ncbi:MAG: hypothetical protein ACI4HO_06630 [Ruminococcus sp.]
MNNISDLFSFVKQYDKEFNPKPVNPLVLNEDGTPKVFYHSTNENFTVFKKGERAGLSGKGIFFFALSAKSLWQKLNAGLFEN